MNCEEIKALLIEDIDGETYAEEHKEIQKHIASCQVCMREYKEMKEFLNRVVQEATAMPSNAENIEKALDRQIIADLVNEVKQLKAEVSALKTEVKRLRTRPLITIPHHKVNGSEVKPKVPSTHLIERQADPWILMRF